MEAHLAGIDIEKGSPRVKVKISSAGSELWNVRQDGFEIQTDIATLKMLVLEFTRAVHAGEMLADHCTSCEKCAFEALGRNKP